jgi:hypothetical protein
MVGRITIAIGAFILICAATLWVLTIPKSVSASALGPHTPDPGKGRILFHAGGCVSCHASPQQEDKTRLGGGLALRSPFGTFYAPNISPDATDGIGAWTEEQFVTALKEGTSPGGEHLYQRQIPAAGRGNETSKGVIPNRRGCCQLLADARSSGSETLLRIRFLARCTIDTHGSRSRKRQGCRCEVTLR